jgi:hypothetical protein
MPSGRRLALAFILAGTLLTLAASQAPAAVTIGQLAPPNPSSETSADTDRAQISVTSGNSYVVPATGGITAWTLTSWSHTAATDPVQELTMKVFRETGGSLAYTAVAHDGPRQLTPGTVNTFQTNLQVTAGDVLGNNSKSPGDNASYFPVPGESFLNREPGLADGQSGTFALNTDGQRLNISAVLEPTNTFALGGITRNKKKGTATLEATVPNPGNMTAAGKGVKASSSAVGAGPVELKIRAKGKKKRKLAEAGKVKLNVALTYTPTGGGASSQAAKVKLRKR